MPSGEKIEVPDRYVRASDFDGELGQANNPEWKTVAFDEAGKVVLPNGAIGFRWGADGRADQGQWNLEAKEARHGHEVKLKLSVQEGGVATRRNGEGRLPVLRRHRQRAFPQQATARCAGAHRARPAHRARQGRRESARRWWPRCSTCRWRTTAWRAVCGRVRREGFRRGHALHAGLAGAHHRHPARAAHHGGAPVRRERAQDARQVDGDHRRGDESLVPQRHELPRRHQHADDVRLHRQERRRLGALRGPGKAPPANRLDGARVRARLDPPAAADEQHQLLLRAHRPVALREARHGRSRSRRSPTRSSTAAA